MLLLNRKVSLNQFWIELRSAERRVLFLDYDGTLAPFSPDRDQAWPYQGIVSILNRIMDDEATRVVVVTGRSCASLLSLLKTTRRPEIWGSHGWEHLEPGVGEVSATRLLDPTSRERLTVGASRLRFAGLAHRLEEKPFSLAAHWRGTGPAEAANIMDITMRSWGDLTDGSELEVHRFDGGLELRVRGRNKGHAVNDTLSSLPSRFATAYLGDDLTDEDAFAALEGRGLRILVRPELRHTRADLWVRPPEELLQFLEAWHQHSLPS